MTPRLHNTDFLDRATTDALRSLDPASDLDPQMVDNPRAQGTLSRILATDPAGPATPPPSVTGWVRVPARRWLLAGVALVAVGALVIIPGLRHGDPAATTLPHPYPTLAGNTEFASWSPTAEAVTPTQAAKAGKECKTMYVRAGSPGSAAGVKVVQNADAVVVDRRGAWTFVLLRGGVQAAFEATCLYEGNGSGKGFTGGLGTSADAGAVPSGTVVVGTGGAGGVGQDSYSWSAGQVGSDVASVVINTLEKGPVKATVHAGHFAAWWPVPDIAPPVRGARKGMGPPEPTYTLTLMDGTIKSAIPQANLGHTSPPVSVAVGKSYVEVLESGDASVMRDGLKLTAPSSVAYHYLDHTANMAEGLPFVGGAVPKPVIVPEGGGAFSACSDPAVESSCATFGGFKVNGNGKLVDLTVNNEPVGPRLTVGDGQSVTAAGARFTLLTAYRSVVSGMWLITVRVQTGAEPIRLNPKTWSYRGPDGKPLTWAGSSAATHVVSSASLVAVVMFESGKAGGRLTVEGCLARLSYAAPGEEDKLCPDDSFSAILKVG